MTTDPSFIVSSHKFYEHKDREAAMREAERLAATEGKTFYVYGVMQSCAAVPSVKELRHASKVQGTSRSIPDRSEPPIA